jgi:amidohydrolase
MTLDELIEKNQKAAVDLRHRLHRIPELGFCEVETARTLRAELDCLHISHIDGIGDAPTATACLIGDPSKPCIALRADIDALPILEETGVAYASTRAGTMHACGHDGHSAILVGVAGVLDSIKNDLSVCVKLIWQPAEEGGGGAEHLVRGGILDARVGPKVRAIFGLHGWPNLPVGSVCTREGAIMAATDNFKITFIGKGCHGAFPHTGIDPIVAASEAVLNLQQAITRDLDPTEPAVVTVSMFNAGTATNIIPDRAVLEGTLRTLSDSARNLLKQAIDRRCNGIAAAAHCTTDIQWIDGYPATVNDPAQTQYVARVARETFGADRFIPAGRSSMGGEDFSYYGRKVPACFFLIGLENQGRPHPSLHSNQFDFTDAAIPVGMRMFVNIARNFSEKSDWPRPK